MTTWLRSRWLPLAVLAVALAGLAGSALWMVNVPMGGQGWNGRAMMPVLSQPGTGPVRDLAGAEHAAQGFADRWGLRVGEVMQFSNGYYAELVDREGEGATEVLVDPDDGAVQVEWGPAMMWNTAFGMHGAGRWEAAIGAEQARTIADRWLRENEPALRAGEAEAFPGYYTLHTMRDGRVAGMLSVHARSGDVWYHTWHGEFIRMSE
jgi:hypothetical protein